MSKEQSIQNDNELSAVDGWDAVIAAAEAEIVRGKSRITELRLAINAFTRLKQKGMPFPGGGVDNASTQI